MPSTPPKLTTANMMLFDSLSSTMSLISPMWLPVASRTAVPATRLARMALVCPVAVVMGASPVGFPRAGRRGCRGCSAREPAAAAGTGRAAVAATSYPAAPVAARQPWQTCAPSILECRLDRSPPHRLRAVRRALAGTPGRLALRRGRRHPHALPGMARAARRTDAAAAARLPRACALVGFRGAVAGGGPSRDRRRLRRDGRFGLPSFVQLPAVLRRDSRPDRRHRHRRLHRRGPQLWRARAAL